ncbi:MAG TPA: hypothetical protein DDZ84_03325 [Firmicutes bacterium]|jgi:acyl-CoA reductase-like NAD-dependent aldehyde dehydrogenase|nr:hypothetical protein [Bacillota bacterium]
MDAVTGGNLLVTTIASPLGVKDRLGDLTATRHPMHGNEDGSMNIGNNLAEKACVIRNAVAAAKAAQKTWAKVPVYEKAAIIKRFIELVQENKEDLARTLSDETGKPIREARAEIADIPIASEAFSDKAKHLYSEVVPPGLEAERESNILMTQREPIGVVACVIPFNFPCDLYDQKVAPALLSGNAAIVKPSTDNPRSSIHVNLVPPRPLDAIAVIGLELAVIGAFQPASQGIDAGFLPDMHEAIKLSALSHALDLVQTAST